MSARLLVALSSVQEARFVTTLGASRSVHVARRCADLPDLLAAAAAGLGTCAAVSPDLPHLERDVVDRLARLGLGVLGVTAEGDEAGERRLRQLGVERVVTATASSAEIDAAVEDVLSRRVPGQATTHGEAHVLRAHRIPAPDAPLGREVDAGLDVDGDAELDRRIEAALGGDLSALRRPVADGRGDEDDLPAEDPAGEIIAVWGPIGAPGRTTVALTLAAEYAVAGSRALLVDADTYGSSVAQALGLLDDVPGLAAAARAAEQGTLDAAGLLRRAPEVTPKLRVLTGLPRADRWPEVRDGAMSTILDVARRIADVVVVDCGFGLEADEELSFDTAAPRRNATTLTTLEQADHLVAVGAGEPIGLQRLVRGLTELGHVSSPPPRVVVTRVRVSAAGPRPSTAIRDVLGRFSGIDDVAVVPDDREACDAAMLAGRTLVEQAPTSPARLALRDLARELLPERVPEPARRRSRRRRVG